VRTSFSRRLEVIKSLPVKVRRLHAWGPHRLWFRGGCLLFRRARPFL